MLGGTSNEEWGMCVTSNDDRVVGDLIFNVQCNDMVRKNIIYSTHLYAEEFIESLSSQNLFVPLSLEMSMITGNRTEEIQNSNEWGTKYLCSGRWIELTTVIPSLTLYDSYPQIFDNASEDPFEFLESLNFISEISVPEIEPIEFDINSIKSTYDIGMVHDFIVDQVIPAAEKINLISEKNIKFHFGEFKIIVQKLLQDYESYIENLESADTDEIDELVESKFEPAVNKLIPICLDTYVRATEFLSDSLENLGGTLLPNTYDYMSEQYAGDRNGNIGSSKFSCGLAIYFFLQKTTDKDSVQFVEESLPEGYLVRYSKTLLSEVELNTLMDKYKLPFKFIL